MSEAGKSVGESPRRYKRGDVRDDGRVFWCYDSSRKNGERWVSKETFAQSRVKNRDAMRKFRKNFPGRDQETNRRYRERNRDKRVATHRNWRRTNPEKWRSCWLASRDKRKQTDVTYALKFNVGCLIRNALRKGGFSKRSRTQAILGCSFEEFRAHLERQFLPGMTWGNRTEWHLDHIIPISLGKTQGQIERLNHYSNLQPLWGKENISKSNKYDGPLPDFLLTA